MALSILTGLLLWSLFEYLSHRFVAHWMDRVCGHHVDPQDYSVGVPWLVIVMAFGLAWCLAPGPVLFGFTLGFVLYARAHYVFHHRTVSSWLMRKLRRNHNVHHYIDDHANYGVTSPLWDIVFGTYK